MKKIYILFILYLFSPQIQAQTEWIQKGVDIDGETSSDRSGSAVSMSSDGGTLAIGSRGNSGGGNVAGHVRVYYWNGANWIQKGMDIDGEAPNDESGWAVSMNSDGNTLAIGAIYNDGIGVDAGHVRIYNWNGSNWIQKGADIDGEMANEHSGFSVSMSSDGNTLAIGATENSGTDTYAGHVRVYNWNGSSWDQKGADIDGEGWDDRSGHSISMSSDGNTLAIGAPRNSGIWPIAGHVRIFNWNGTNWTQKGADIDSETANHYMGWSISISSDGNTLAIGASEDTTSIPYEGHVGHVRVYNWNGTLWTQKGLDIDGEMIDDNSGRSVSISSDGNTVAIGAHYNAGLGLKTGHVRVYEWNDASIWVQKGIDIDGEAINDQSGYSVSISSNGKILAIGAPWNSGTSYQAGHVRVYEFPVPGAGLLENDLSDELIVYPNPTTGSFSIKFESTQQSTVIKLTDLAGREVQSKTYYNSQLLNLNIEESTGVYLLIIESDDKRAVIQIVKK
ncbi:MAG: hypothetical protein COA99_19520 [Moraxellaceae bacterium]|nr:MAG: hypothetical protein COA99_19520 [Moraxellaceae bacterium]